VVAQLEGGRGAHQRQQAGARAGPSSSQGEEGRYAATTR
jgi:hypothetical protein